MSLPTFDQLMALFKTDPEAFESLRKRVIEEEMHNAMPRHLRRLRGIQFQIDSLRRTSKNPLDCCVKIQRVLDDKLAELSAVLYDRHCPAEKQIPQNNIIPLSSRDDADQDQH